MAEKITRCGHIAIIGRPNVGKSTLLNHLLGEKLSITCRKPQTTRHTIFGIKTQAEVQMIFVDTPGLHQKTPQLLNRYLNRAALSVLQDVDVIVWLVEPVWRPDDTFILKHIQHSQVPVILVINKIDQEKDKAQLLPYLKELAGQFSFKTIIPISAKHDQGLDALEAEMRLCLPEREFSFAEDELTDKSMRFIAAEAIREKLMRYLGEELPYATTVVVDRYEEYPGLIKIAATIFVTKASQKAIVIGEQGAKLREIGRFARLDLQKRVHKKIYLQLWVKVKAGWADNEQTLQALGYSV